MPRVLSGDETSESSPNRVPPKPATLGVGLLYNPALPEYLQARPDSYDYLSIIPDMFWTDRGRGVSPRFAELASWVQMLDWVAHRKPLVAHNIGMSLGSAGNFDESYIEHLLEWHQRYHFHWHSDHLSFVSITTEGHDHNAGLAIPVPYDEDVLKMLRKRVELVQQIISSPFLVENNVYFIDVPQQDMSETEFLNRLSSLSGCGLLLDLHNVYANSRNHRFDAKEFIGQLDLDRVVELHIAGGSELDGTYTDSHSGPCPAEVWDLLEWVRPKVPNLAGVTFEFHDSYYPLLKFKGIEAELRRAREIIRT